MSSQNSDTLDCGDFADSEDECEVEESAESIERYQPGQYYPICIGELLAQRYRIEHKLGHGGFSTVWMAYDIQEKRTVALKILVPGSAGDFEISMQEEIIRTVRDTSHLLIYQSSFSLPGHHCKHQVLVFPVRGPNLGTCLRERSVASRMSAARQLLQALECLHEAGIVHRDLNNKAVMWGIASLDDYNTDTKYKYLGRPQKIALAPDMWRQGELVRPMNVPENLLRESIYLGDFGISIKAGTSVSEKVQSPAAYCAPERFHNVDPSFASDMWSYMCLFTELYVGFQPFYRNWNPALVSHVVHALGPLPEQWKDHYNADGTNEDWWYDKNTIPDPTMTLEAMIERLRPETSPKERSLVLAILAKGFCYLPEHRITATQLLQDPSFNAFMAIYGS